MTPITLSLHKHGHYISYFQENQECRLPLPGEDWTTSDQKKCTDWVAERITPQTPVFSGVVRYPRTKDHLPLGNPLEVENLVYTHYDLGWRALQRIEPGSTHLLWTDDWTYALGNELPDLDAYHTQTGQYPVWWQGKSYRVACLFSGNEQERQIQHLADYFGVQTADIHEMPYSSAMVRKLRERFPQVIPTQASTDYLMDCPFVERSLNAFRSIEEAYHQFMLDLVAQQVAAWTQVTTFPVGAKLMIGGKLAQCPHFMHGMAEVFFAQEVYGATGVSLPEWYLLSPDGVMPTVQRYR